MIGIWKFVYTFIIVPLMYAFFYGFSKFNSKVKRGLKERKRIFENLIINLTDLNRKKKMIWFHSASMGEFEQAKPIIENIKSAHDVNVVVTFFSPSGYDNSVKYPFADIVSYLPFDFPGTVRRFIRLIKPNLVVFMRYDLWPNVVWELDTFKIPIFLVDATLRQQTKRRFPVVRGVYRSIYAAVSKILAVSDEDLENFVNFGVPADKCLRIGDTRFDRVYIKSQQAKEAKIFADNIFEGKRVFVAGSTWPSDEEVILPAILKLNKYIDNFITILVPHEPTIQQLERLENELYGKISSIRFSRMNKYSGEKIIIIDTIGILLTLYYYAHIAYVGGSFRPGVHNVLEPAVYSVPVLFGPKIENSREAKELAALGSGIKITNKKQAYRNLRRLITDDPYRQQLGLVSGKYVREHLGATDRIITEILSVF